MRGLAAMLVVVGHCSAVFDLGQSILRFPQLLLNGEGAVVFFFVLSGFVLSLQWVNGAISSRPIAAYLFRRITRIYPMLIVSVTIGTVYCNYVHARAPLAIGTNWYNSFYQKDIDAFHFLLSAIGYSGRPAPPLWSLFVELVGSALVPLFILTATNTKRKYAIGFVLLLISFAFYTGFHFNFPVYLIDFYIGASIMWWGRPFTDRFEIWRPIARITTVTALITVFFLARLILSQGSYLPVFNLIEVACTAPLVALLYYGSREIPFLRSKAMLSLGDLSYSIYVVHFPIMYFNVHMFMQLLQNPENYPVEILTLMVVVGTTMLTITVSILTYRRIEVPFIEIGKRLPKRWRKQPSNVSL